MDVYVIPAGTAAAPGIQFYGDLDTGIYRAGANQLGITVGGVSVGYFDSTGWIGNIAATTLDATNIEVTNVKAKDGTAAFSIADSTGVVTVSTQLNVDNLRLDGNTLSSTDSNGNIVIAPNGTGDVQIDADTIRVGDSNADVTITSNGTADLILNTNGGTNSGSITIADGTNGNISITPNGTGEVALPKVNIDSGTIDNTVIGGSTAAAANFTTVDATTVEVTNLKAKDGTTSVELANSTGYVGLGTAPSYRLHLTGSTDAGARIFASSSATSAITTSALELSRTTTASGTRVVGGILFTHTLTDSTKSTAGTITLTATNTPGAEASELILEANSIVLSGTVTAATLNSTTIDTTNLEVTNVKAKDGTAAIVLTDSTGAVAVSTALTANGGAVFNENGANVDFRVEGDTDANLLFVDASADAVGIGTATVTSGYKLEVSGSGVRNTATNPFYDLYATGQATNAKWWRVGGGGADFVVTAINDAGSGSDTPYRITRSAQVAQTHQWSTASSERMRLTSTGTLNIVGAGTAGTSQAVSINGSTPVNTLVTTSGGNVGIGTDSPTTAYGYTKVIDIAGSFPGIKFTPSGASTFGFQIGAGTSGFQFYDVAASAERMRIDSSGNLGIGTTSPFSKLAVSNGTTRLETSPSSSNVIVQALNEARTATTELLSAGSILTYWTGASGSQSERARITSGGEVYIAGTTDQGAYNLQVNGTGVWGAGAYVNGSDARLKEEVTTIDSAIDVVTALRPVTFRYKESHSKDQSIQPGFIAQELQAAMVGKSYVDGIVKAGPEYLNVAYQSLIPLLTKAIQEQQAMINELKAEVAALKGA
jgi:hypothetical protein